MAFVDLVKEKATSYLGYEPKQLDVDLAIEKFQDLRNYPNSYTDTMITADMTKNLNKIAMAVVEYDAKDGIEGQISHSENGINRSYGVSAIPKAYSTVIAFAHVF